MSGAVRAVLARLGATLAAVLAGVAVLAAATVGAAAHETVARAWLVVFAVGSAAPVGATVLLMIAALTGARWGEDWRPILGPLAAGTVLAALGFLPVAVSLAASYPWAADPASAPPGVARLYLNPPFFLVRAALALAGWSALGLLFGLGRPPALLAALGLAFHGFAISLVAVDWFLSVEPGHASTSFATTVAVLQIGTALSAVALLGRAGVPARARGDLGAFLVTTQVGAIYLVLMAFVIAWYGDLPEAAAWYGRRQEGVWLPLALAAVAFGSAIPFGILLRRAWRRGGPMLRLAGASSLAGVAFYFVWLLGPALGGQATALASGGLAVVGAALALAARRRRSPARAG